MKRKYNFDVLIYYTSILDIKFDISDMFAHLHIAFSFISDNAIFFNEGILRGCAVRPEAGNKGHDTCTRTDNVRKCELNII